MDRAQELPRREPLRSGWVKSVSAEHDLARTERKVAQAQILRRHADLNVETSSLSAQDITRSVAEWLSGHLESVR